MSAPSDASVLDVALRVARAIETCGGEYFVGGSVASSLQGDPRATNDIAFVLSLPLGRVRAFRDALGADFEVDTDLLKEALMRSTTTNAFFLPFVTKIDFFGRGREPYDEAEFSRRRAVQIRPSGETLVVKASEDTVLRKLLWYRAGGEVSDKQWRDVQSVLRISGGEMDVDYLDVWAKRLNVDGLLARARSTP